MRKRNREQVPTLPLEPTWTESLPPTPEALTGLAAEIMHFWRLVREADARRQPDMFPGLLNSFHDGRAQVTNRIGRPFGFTVSAYRNEAGFWQLERQVCRPGLELEPQLSVLQTTTVYAVAPGESTLRDVEIYRERQDGTKEIIEVPQSIIGPPLDGPSVAHWTADLHELNASQRLAA